MGCNCGKKKVSVQPRQKIVKTQPQEKAMNNKPNKRIIKRFVKQFTKKGGFDYPPFVFNYSIITVFQKFDDFISFMIAL